VHVPMFPRGCQGKERKYFRRRDYRVEALLDWEVRELLGRSVQPAIEVIIGRHPTDGPSELRLLKVSLRNSGTVCVHDWKVVLQVPSTLIQNSTVSYAGEEELPARRFGQWYKARTLTFANGGGAGPLFPGETRPLLSAEGRGGGSSVTGGTRKRRC